MRFTLNSDPMAAMCAESDSAELTTGTLTRGESTAYLSRKTGEISFNETIFIDITQNFMR